MVFALVLAIESGLVFVIVVMSDIDPAEEDAPDVIFGRAIAARVDSGRSINVNGAVDPVVVSSASFVICLAQASPINSVFQFCIRKPRWPVLSSSEKRVMALACIVSSVQFYLAAS